MLINHKWDTGEIKRCFDTSIELGRFIKVNYSPHRNLNTNDDMNSKSVVFCSFYRFIIEHKACRSVSTEGQCSPNQTNRMVINRALSIAVQT